MVAQTVLQKAPDAAIHAIFNAALNARKNVFFVPLHLKIVIRHYIHHFEILIDCTRPIAIKQRLIHQTGGALPLFVPLSATDFGSIGKEFFHGYYGKIISSFSKTILI